MTVSEELEEQAAEAGQWLRELEISDLNVPDDLSIETVTVAIETDDTNMYVCWPNEGVTVKGKKQLLVEGCIRVSTKPLVFFTKTGVVIRESRATGRTLLFLRRRAVTCYEQVRASELAAKLSDKQLRDLYSTLKRVTRRRKPSDASDA